MRREYVRALLFAICSGSVYLLAQRRPGVRNRLRKIVQASLPLPLKFKPVRKTMVKVIRIPKVNGALRELDHFLDEAA